MVGEPLEHLPGQGNPRIAKIRIASKDLFPLYRYLANDICFNVWFLTGIYG
jgi:hypothetical protein